MMTLQVLECFSWLTKIILHYSFRCDEANIAKAHHRFLQRYISGIEFGNSDFLAIYRRLIYSVGLT